MAEFFLQTFWNKSRQKSATQQHNYKVNKLFIVEPNLFVLNKNIISFATNDFE